MAVINIHGIAVINIHRIAVINIHRIAVVHIHRMKGDIDDDLVVTALSNS